MSEWLDRFERSDITPEMEIAIFWRDYVESGMAQEDWDYLARRARALLDAIARDDSAAGLQQAMPHSAGPFLWWSV